MGIDTNVGVCRYLLNQQTLSILVSNLSNDLFLTRIRAKEFWQNLGNIIKAQNPNMLKEYEAALTKARTEEFKKLQDIFLQKNSIST